MSPNSLLCSSCDRSSFAGQNRKVDHQRRQSQARAAVQEQQRDLDTSSLSSLSDMEPSRTETTNNPASNLPNLDLNVLQNNYNNMFTNGSAQPGPEMFRDMYGMMLSLMTKQSNNEKDNKDLWDRVLELEAKNGGPEEISIRLGICIKHLPLPIPGQSELENVRRFLSEISSKC